MSSAQSTADIEHMVLSMMNSSADPCNDFYSYANGQWLADTVLPADKSSVERSITQIEEHNNDVLLAIMADKSNTLLYGLGQRCQDMDERNKVGAQALEPSVVAALSQSFDLKLFLRQAAAATKRGAAPLFSFYSAPQPKVPEVNVATLSQGGFTLPVPSLYSGSDDTSVHLQKALIQYASELFVAFGLSAQLAAQHAHNAFALEAAIAKNAVDPANMGDPFSLYHPLNASALVELSGLPLAFYFDEAMGRLPEQFVVDEPAFYAGLGAALHAASGDSRGAYLAFKILDAAASSLSEPFVNASFQFYGKTLGGQQQMSPLSLRCANAAIALYPTHAGVAFSALSFPDSAKQTLTTMVEKIQAQLKLDIAQLSWMTNQTKVQATDKINLLLNVVGPPANPDLSSAPLGTAFIDSALAANERLFAEMVATVDEKVDRLAAEMSNAVVNAFYDPSRNTLNILAGISQAPYFDAKFPVEMNAAGIGVIAGHETTHSLDSSGSQYNGRGKLTNWWTPADLKQFNERVQCVIDQYDQFPVVPGVNVDGNLVKGEAVADLGGVKFSFLAFVDFVGGSEQADKPSIVPGLTRKQLYFVAYAQGWAAVQTPQIAVALARSDPHPPPKARATLPLQSLDFFSDAFNCPIGSYMNPVHKCKVW